jgi:hypothetical protein
MKAEKTTKRRSGCGKLVGTLIAAFAVVLVSAGTAWTQTAWVDEITNSLAFYKANYPTSNFEPYAQKLTKVRDALRGGDKQAVRTEMGNWFKMLRGRAHGINEVAADELFNFAVMVTPIEEYGISVPSPPTQMP